MVEYLRSVWLADLDFYSRALRVGCSVKCLPGYPTFLCQAMCLCWSFFQFSETCLRCWMLTWIWPPSTLLWNTLGLCMSITNCAAVVAFGDDVLSGFSQHESWQKYGRNYALVLGFFFECEFLTSFVPLLQDILGLTPAFSSGHANILVIIYLIEGFQKHSLLVRSLISGVTPESRLETQIPSAGL